MKEIKLLLMLDTHSSYLTREKNLSAVKWHQPAKTSIPLLCLAVNECSF